ncbi:MAG: sulfotransferase [bacterium]
MVSEEVRRRLRYVKASGSEELSRFPDFLIIGPQRTGTTWLHAHLRYHPQVLLSEPKELYFFSSLQTREAKRFVSDELGWYLRFFRDAPWRRAAKIALCLQRYGELYRPLVRGEATASYAAIDPSVIDDIVVLKPDIKALLMIRHPIERAWSHAKKDLVRNRKRAFDDVRAEEFRAFFAEPYQRRCARYAELADAWSARLQPGRLYVGVFDEIATRPHEMLLDVMRFLGVRADPKYVDPDAGNPVNPTASTRIPPEHRAYLAELFADDLRAARERFGVDWK